MNCYICKGNDESTSVYELKQGGTVDICLVCENTYEYYLDVIKRECLIDGESQDVTRDDERIIRKERELREKEEQRQKDYDKLVDSDGSIFYFSNEQLRTLEYNHSVLRYASGFLDIGDDYEDHVQRFKFNYAIDKHWYIDEWDGLRDVNIYLDNVKKETQKVKKPEETNWRERTRKWYSGRFECHESLYNVTFGFSRYDNEPCGEVWINYDFICSKSYKIARLIKGLLKDDGWQVKE